MPSSNSIASAVLADIPPLGQIVSSASPLQRERADLELFREQASALELRLHLPAGVLGHGELFRDAQSMGFGPEVILHLLVLQVVDLAEELGPENLARNIDLPTALVAPEEAVRLVAATLLGLLDGGEHTDLLWAIALIDVSEDVRCQALRSIPAEKLDRDQTSALSIGFEAASGQWKMAVLSKLEAADDHQTLDLIDRCLLDPSTEVRTTAWRTLCRRARRDPASHAFMMSELAACDDQGDARFFYDCLVKEHLLGSLPRSLVTRLEAAALDPSAEEPDGEKRSDQR